MATQDTTKTFLDRNALIVEGIDRYRSKLEHPLEPGWSAKGSGGLKAKVSDASKSASEPLVQQPPPRHQYGNYTGTMSKPKSSALAKDEVPLPHPAEDLSSDDDLLSWILVDQLGCMPNSRLGVHPQENKFVGPVFKTDDVLQIIRETVILGNVQAGMARLQEFPLIQAHLQGKRTVTQRDRFIQHLRRYLLCYTPTSRVDIHSTDRYSHVSKHPELAVFATRPLAVGTVLQELQGSVVPLPDLWREEMDLGDDYDLARAAAGHESDESEDEEEEEEVEVEEIETTSRRKGKEVDRGLRRSDRTRRRDFSIVWSGLKRCYQLFLGPARFLNHDCSPTVELLRQGNHVTFRVLRAVKIGEELTAYYGHNYFGKDNNECLCLSCEQSQRGRFAPKTEQSRSTSETRSETPMTPQKPKLNRPSNLRREFFESNSSEASASDLLGLGVESAPGDQSSVPGEDIEDGSDSDTAEPVVRERLSRLAKTNSKPWNFLKYPKSAPSDAESSSFIDEDLPEDFPRCGSCARALHDRMWYAGRYFDHCARCTRHAFIYGLPWPAHRQSEVQEYPPSHLIPNGYIPRKISSIPLPSLQKKKYKEVLVEVPPEEPIPVSREYRMQLRLRKEIAMEDFTVQSLREAAWMLQVAQEDAVLAAEAAAAARIEARRVAQEEKRRRDANTIKGTGVWSRYEYVDEEELARRAAERNAPTNGTRRGRIFNVEEGGQGQAQGAGPAARSVAAGQPSPKSQPAAESGSRRIHQISIPSGKRKKAKEPPTAPEPVKRSPTLRLFVSGAGQTAKSSASTSRPAPAAASRKRPAASSSSSSTKPKKRPKNDLLPSRSIHLPLPPSTPYIPNRSSQSSGESGSTIFGGLDYYRKRGRPKGSGKNQMAAAKADEDRRLSQSSAAGPSTSHESVSPPVGAKAPRYARVPTKPYRYGSESDDEILEQGIKVIMDAVTPTAASKSNRRKEKSSSGSSGEPRKVRSFFPISKLPVLRN